MFVLFACFWQPCFVVVAIKMFHELNSSVYWKPIGMHIPKAHKDRNHNTAFMEILVFFHFFYHNDMSVGWSNNNLFGIFSTKIANRTAIEVQNNAIDCSKNRNEYPKRYFILYAKPKRQSYQPYGNASI